jgi:hypothetical protein
MIQFIQAEPSLMTVQIQKFIILVCITVKVVDLYTLQFS